MRVLPRPRARGSGGGTAAAQKAVDFAAILGRKVPTRRADVVVDLLGRLATTKTYRHCRVLQHPGDGKLEQRMAALLGPAAEWRRPGQHPAELIALKAGHLGAFVVRGEDVPRLEPPAEQTLGQRAV